MRPMSSTQTGHLFFRRPFHLRLAVLGHHAVVFGLGVAVLGLLAPCAYGTVQSQNGDDVIPADNPFTPTIDEGLPDLGHSIDPFKGATALDQEDYWDGTGFEGRYDVIVGKSAYGALLISGGSDLRAEHLIIGDSENQPLPVDPYRDFDPSATGVRGADLLVGNGTGLHGTGVVRIEGFSSLYNNDYTILPPGLPSTFGPAAREQDDGGQNREGFDAYVGRWGNGRLEITAGGRAEIQDAVIVGDFGSAVGVLVVDGVGSFLGSGGIETANDPDPTPGGTPAEDDNRVHYFSVGRLGSGTVNILNGGQVLSRSPADSAGAPLDFATAAVIGGRETVRVPNAAAATAPIAGGTGYVVVDGVGSTWTVSGNLQVGSFHLIGQDLASEHFEGDDANYDNSSIGRGTLTVSNGGLVSIVPPAAAANQNVSSEELDFLIGRYGTVQLQGGRIELLAGTPFNDPEDPLVDPVRIVNDGVIAGSGSIETGLFHNRYYGQVRVSAGESLVVTSYAVESLPVSSPPDVLMPLANYGVIEVLGTVDNRAELEFDRSPEASSADLTNAFHNYRLTTPAPLPYPAPVSGGLISAQHATLRFRSGLDNHGMLAFTDGVNYVGGNVFNAGPADPLGEGVIYLGSVTPESVTVIFENSLVNAGTIVVGTNNVEILDRRSFTTTGTLIIGLNDLLTGQVEVAGDVGITGALKVVVDGSLGTLSAGDTFEIISAMEDGHLGGVLVDPQTLMPEPDLSQDARFTSVVMPDISSFGAGLMLVTEYTSNSVRLLARSTALVSGADFDGSGFVDLFDLAVWRGNFGIASGAFPWQGDADGDGDVDGQDFLLLQQQLGGPPSGAGAGAFLGGGAVPEPASGMLLVSGALLALAAIRRQHALR